MNNRLKIGIVISCLMTVIWVGCRNEGKPGEQDKQTSKMDTVDYRYNSVSVASEITRSKNDDNLSDTTKATIKYPKFTDDTLDYLVMRQVFDFFAKDEPVTSYEDIADSFIRGFDSFAKEYPERNHSWYLDIDISVLNQNRNYVGIKYVHSDYAGGAHGMTTISYINYSPISKKLLTIDSIVATGKKDNLIKIAEEIFRKNENISSTQPLSDNYFFENGKFALANNFYLSKEGLEFIYNPYEIKPYSEGHTKLTIPFSALENIIKAQYISKTP